MNLCSKYIGTEGKSDVEICPNGTEILKLLLFFDKLSKCLA